jgi:hypothetical protein
VVCVSRGGQALRHFRPERIRSISLSGHSHRHPKRFCFSNMSHSRLVLPVAAHHVDHRRGVGSRCGEETGGLGRTPCLLMHRSCSTPASRCASPAPVCAMQHTIRASQRGLGAVRCTRAGACGVDRIGPALQRLPGFFRHKCSAELETPGQASVPSAYAQDVQIICASRWEVALLAADASPAAAWGNGCSCSSLGSPDQQLR